MAAKEVRAHRAVRRCFLKEEVRIQRLRRVSCTAGLRYLHRSAPLVAGLALCDRGPCSVTLFPPQAARGFAAPLDSHRRKKADPHA